MIKLRPWKGTKNEFEVDIIVNGANGQTLRKRVKAPVTGKSNAERWARSLEQEMLAQLLAPEPEPEKPPAPTFEEFAVIFLDLCRASRLGVNTMLNYEVHLRLYLLPVLARRRLMLEGSAPPPKTYADVPKDRSQASPGVCPTGDVTGPSFSPPFLKTADQLGHAIDTEIETKSCHGSQPAAGSRACLRAWCPATSTQ